MHLPKVWFEARHCHSVCMLMCKSLGFSLLFCGFRFLPVVVPHHVCSLVRLFLGSAGLDHALLGVFLGLNKLLNFIEYEVVSLVVIGGTFLHDITGYDDILQSLNQDVCMIILNILFNRPGVGGVCN